MKINMGCGKDIRKGWLNIDYKKVRGVDKVVDLNKFPYPFKDNSADEIFMDHVFDHLHYPNKTLQECLRILKPGKKLVMIVPHFTSSTAYLGELRPYLWSHNAFIRFDPKHDRSYYFDWHYSRVQIRFEFQKSPVWLFWPHYFVEKIANWQPYAYENTWLRMFPCRQLVVTFTK